jgi:hypothetical protein
LEDSERSQGLREESTVVAAVVKALEALGVPPALREGGLSKLRSPKSLV